MIVKNVPGWSCHVLCDHDYVLAWRKQRSLGAGLCPSTLLYPGCHSLPLGHWRDTRRGTQLNCISSHLLARTMVDHVQVRRYAGRYVV